MDLPCSSVLVEILSFREVSEFGVLSGGNALHRELRLCKILYQDDPYLDSSALVIVCDLATANSTAYKPVKGPWYRRHGANPGEYSINLPGKSMPAANP